MADPSEILAALERAVLDGDDRTVVVLARRALEAGSGAPRDHRAGPRAGDPQGRRALGGGRVLPPRAGRLGAGDEGRDGGRCSRRSPGTAAARALGRVVIGTVHGDIHDIGKTLVGTLLSANGFAVSDEGADVPAERFVARARELDADLVCASALLTTTMAGQRELVGALRRAGLRARVMVGRCPGEPGVGARDRRRRVRRQRRGGRGSRAQAGGR